MHTDLDEARLDQPEALLSADPGEMLRSVASAGALVRRAAATVGQDSLAVLAADGRPRSVVVVGMGAAGSAGDVLAAVTGPGCPVPVLTHRASSLPGWVGPMDLVAVVSASGVTEEAREAADEAVRRGTRLLVVTDPGSPLAETGARGRATLLPVERSTRPARVRLWEMAVPLLVAADALHLADVPAAVLESAADLLDTLAGRCGPEAETFENPAKALAARLAGSVPLVWASGEVSGAAAYRFGGQLAVNARYPSMVGSLPEAGHHQLAVLEGPFGPDTADEDDFFRDRLTDPFGSPRLRLVLLRDDAEEHPRVTRRREAVGALAESRGWQVDELVAEGSHRLERLASLLAVTDYASVYLALLLGIDPAGGSALADEVRDRAGT